MNYIETMKQALEELSRSFVLTGYENEQRHVKAITNLRAAIQAAKKQQDFCYCNDEISLQIVSGGAAPEGLYGRVTLKIGEQYIDYARSGAAEKCEPVAWMPSAEWTPCVKLPVTVHVRKQREGETHVSTREGITPIKPDDLIMRGVSGEEYPIGRKIFEMTYHIGDHLVAQPPIIDLYENALKASWPKGAEGKAYEYWNEARKLLAATPQQAVIPEGWQPIETAPKDGTRILLTCKSIVSDGFWEKGAFGGNGCWVWPYVHKEPTHWMLLPAAPEYKP